MNGCSGVNWFTLLCLCRTRGRAGDKLMRRRLSSEFCTKNRTLPAAPPPPHSPVTPNTLHKVEWKHKEVMQGDRMSSPRRLNSCSDPRGVVKRAPAAVIRLSYLLFHCSHPALRLLIRLLRTSQRPIDFPPHYYSCHNPPARLTDGHFLFHCFCRVAVPDVLHDFICPSRTWSEFSSVSFQLFVVIVMGDGAVFNLLSRFLSQVFSANLEIHWRLFSCWVDDKCSVRTADLLLNSPTVYFLMAAYKAQLHCLRAAVKLFSLFFFSK